MHVFLNPVINDGLHFAQEGQKCSCIRLAIPHLVKFMEDSFFSGLKFPCYMIPIGSLGFR